MSSSSRTSLLFACGLTSVALGVSGYAVLSQQRMAGELEELRAALAEAAEASRTPSLPGVPTDPGPRTTPLPRVDLGQGSLADVVERVLPGVVNISTSRGGVRGVAGRFPNAPSARHGSDSLGSGVVVSDDGLVVTNHHVIASGGTIVVTLSDGREFPADVVGADPQTDMALLRLRGVTEPLTAIPYGDSSRLRQGDVVLAIGNPFGVGQTVTMGIVSAIGRADMGIAEYEDFVQTDAAINPGNSGGALVSATGELMGINTAILSRTGGSQGIGFAIPSNMLRPIVDSLLRHGKVVRGWLGVTIQDVTPELARALGIPATRGVIVSGLEPGSPAEASGLAAGDLILELDREQLGSSAQLRNLVATRGAGARIEVVISRGGERRTLEVELGERPAVPLDELDVATGTPGRAPEASAPVPPMGVVDVDGLGIVDLDARARAALRIPSDIRYGAAVIGARRGTPGERAGLMPGDVIVEINRTPVRSASHLASEYARVGGGAVLLVRRGPGSIYVLMR